MLGMAASTSDSQRAQCERTIGGAGVAGAGDELLARVEELPLLAERLPVGGRRDAHADRVSSIRGGREREENDESRE